MPAGQSKKKNSMTLFAFPNSVPVPRPKLILAALIALVVLTIFVLPTYAQGGSYVVQPGDTLSEIAASYGTNAATLMQINGLSNGHHIWVGQTLSLSDSASSASYSAPSGGSGTGSTYAVQPGDTLTGIAASFGTTVENLRALNGMTASSPLLSGSTLSVSGNGVTSTQTTTSSAASYSTDGDTHIVQQGESLGMIAAKYGTTVDILKSANGLTNASLIGLGQSLTIPAGTAADVASLTSSTSSSSTHTPTSGKWIDVNLSNQQVLAYEDGVLINSFVVSTGLPRYPTVTGTFRIWGKTPVQDMSGGNRASGEAYYLEDVQWVQYFYEDYAFHAADWHNRFGQPMSRGCINMRPDNAKWLYDWAGPDQVDSNGLSYSSPENNGTLVIVHD